MAKISDVEIPALLFDEQATAPTTPASTLWKIYFKSDGLYVVDDVGAETGPLTAGGASTFVGCRLRKSTNTTLTGGAVDKISFDTEDFDTDGFHEGVTNPTRLTIPSGQGGIYMVGAQGYFSVGGARNIITIRKNNNSALDVASVEATGTGTGHTPRLATSTLVALVATDYLEMAVFADSSRNLDAIAFSSPVLWAYRVGDTP